MARTIRTVSDSFLETELDRIERVLIRRRAHALRSKRTKGGRNGARAALRRTVTA
jgi:hypothetical protein